MFECLKSSCLISDGKLFQSRGAAAANALRIVKRTLCATDDQCSSVDRTQSSDIAVSDESAVVSQVAWDVARQTPMNKCGDLVADALPHWKPVQAADEAPVRCGHIVVCQ